MKKLLLLSCLISTPLLAESNSKGPNSPISVGVIESISEDGKTIQILQEGEHQRSFSIPNSKVIEFVGMPESDRFLKAGYGIKAKLNGTVLKSAKITLPTEAPSDLGPEKTTMSISEIHQKSDDNNDELVDYIEMSRWIYFSPKHGPDKFSKFDKNKDGGLNEKEFSELIAGVSWWMYSRMSSQDWFIKADKNGDQALSISEYKTISNSKSHVENHFKRYDTDKSGSLSLEELNASLNGSVSKKKKSKS